MNIFVPLYDVADDGIASLVIILPNKRYGEMVIPLNLDFFFKFSMIICNKKACFVYLCYIVSGSKLGKFPPWI